MPRYFSKIKSILKFNVKETQDIITKINLLKNKDIIAIYNPECLGIMNSTKDLFGDENTIAIKELLNERQIEYVVEAFSTVKAKQIIFSSITFGWGKLISKLHEKRPDIKIKIFWHGAHAMLIQRDESYFFYKVLALLEEKVIYSIAFAKYSMAEFYTKKGYKSYFLPNTIKSEKLNEIKKRNNTIRKDNKNVYIGLYSAGERWEKNTYNQLSSVSMIKNAIVDIIPVTDLGKSFCKLFNIKINDETLNYMSREKLLERIKDNDVNMYVTFTECSPMLPLESLELGVPCITGNNHNYFKGTKLFEYLVVDSEDNIDEIAEKLQYAIKNKEEIISLYKSWKKEYDLFVETKFNEFIGG
ncbi:MAG: hypothetical protein RSB67_00030 [Clostridia bacterium]